MSNKKILKIVTIIGARPQFIKASAVSRAIKKFNMDKMNTTRIKELIVHTGQHYDENMSKIFFDDLNIPKPVYNLNVGSGSHGVQTGEMLAAIEGVIIDEYPDAILIYGDTNSTLAGALVASKIKYDLKEYKKKRRNHLPLAEKVLRPILVHVEAGLRSYNRRMPEEVNRIVSDELSDLLLCPTDVAVRNLKKEGIGQNDKPAGTFSSKMPLHLAVNTGDVMYDTALHYLTMAEKKSCILEKLNLIEKGNKVSPYILCTIHRAENTDDIKRLTNILEAFNNSSNKGLRIVLPIHPRTNKIIKKNKLKVNFEVMEPFGYLDMLLLEKNAIAIATDSGGIQKEAYFFKTPCITLRDETEWVETVISGWNVLAGADTDEINKSISLVANKNRMNERPPFELKTKKRALTHSSDYYYGKGDASKKIIEVLVGCFE